MNHLPIKASEVKEQKLAGTYKKDPEGNAKLKEGVGETKEFKETRKSRETRETRETNLI